MPTAIIHCGVHKTGSSSIQAALRDARDRLRAHGFLYPRVNQSNLSLCFRTASEHYLNRRRGFASPEALAAATQRTLETFQAELSGQPDANLILSSEDYSASDTDLPKLVDYLRAHGFDDIRFIIYLRDHLSYCESALQQRIKGGNYVDLADANNFRPRPYKPLLQTMEQLVSRKKISVRTFTGEFLKNRDVVADFQELAGLQAVELKSVRLNESLSAAAMVALNELNKRLQAFNAGGPSVYFEGTIDELRKHEGPAYRLDQKQARQLVKESKSDRHYLAEHWFGGNDPFAAAMQAALDDPQRRAKPVSAEAVYDLLAQLYAVSQLNVARFKRAKLELDLEKEAAAGRTAVTQKLDERVRILKRRLAAVLHKQQTEDASS